MPRRLDVVGEIADASNRWCPEGVLVPADARTLLLAPAAALDGSITRFRHTGAQPEREALRDSAIAMGAAALRVSRLARPSEIRPPSVDHLHEILGARTRLVDTSLEYGPDSLGRWHTAFRRELDASLAATQPPSGRRVGPMRLALARATALCVELAVWADTNTRGQQAGAA